MGCLQIDPKTLQPPPALTCVAVATHHQETVLHPELMTTFIWPEIWVHLQRSPILSVPFCLIHCVYSILIFNQSLWYGDKDQVTKPSWGLQENGQRNNSSKGFLNLSVLRCGAGSTCTVLGHGVLLTSGMETGWLLLVLIPATWEVVLEF